MTVLAHMGNVLVEPLLFLALPMTIVGVWEWRSRRRRTTAG
jgi:nicotinamide riboside transporter PnuC